MVGFLIYTRIAFILVSISSIKRIICSYIFIYLVFQFPFRTNDLALLNTIQAHE